MTKRFQKKLFLIVVLIVISLFNFVDSRQSEPLESPIPQTLGNTETLKDLFVVTKVIDGDTFEIEGGQKVRMIGIDTPETRHPTKKVECFGIEASDKAKELLGQATVALEKDVSETDRYGRLLRYVYIGEELINETLVKEGYAYAVSFPPDIKYQERLLEAEKAAREGSLGLWGNKCS